MTHAGFIFAAWILVGASMALYSVRLMARGRSLTRMVDPSRRRWMNSPEATTKSRADRSP